MDKRQGLSYVAAKDTNCLKRKEVEQGRNTDISQLNGRKFWNNFLQLHYLNYLMADIPILDMREITWAQ